MDGDAGREHVALAENGVRMARRELNAFTSLRFSTAPHQLGAVSGVRGTKTPICHAATA
jgi:hypothetical protein